MTKIPMTRQELIDNIHTSQDQTHTIGENVTNIYYDTVERAYFYKRMGRDFKIDSGIRYILTHDERLNKDVWMGVSGAYIASESDENGVLLDDYITTRAELRHIKEFLEQQEKEDAIDDLKGWAQTIGLIILIIALMFSFFMFIPFILFNGLGVSVGNSLFISFTIALILFGVTGIANGK